MSVEIEAIAPSTPEAGAILREYMSDIVGRHWARPATPAEVDLALAQDPSDDLTGETGTLVVARIDRITAGCGGVRFLAGDVGELTRIFVNEAHRRHRIGARVVAELERRARDRGCRVMRLDTRHDLTEAQALYASLGYQEVAPFNQEQHADHWFSKRLS